LWKTAHQRVLLDEGWLAAVLSTQTTPVFTSTTAVRAPSDQVPGMQSAALPRIDWVGALDVSHFTGREGGLAELIHCIAHERCRLVAILGMGGIGKSALASLYDLDWSPVGEFRYGYPGHHLGGGRWEAARRVARSSQACIRRGVECRCGTCRPAPCAGQIVRTRPGSGA
jgi:hypothetical protein